MTERSDMFSVNTTRPRQNGHHFADDVFKCNFFIWLYFFYRNIIELCSQGSYWLWSSIGLDIGLQNRRQAIIWTNGGLIYWRVYGWIDPNEPNVRISIHLCGTNNGISNDHRNSALIYVYRVYKGIMLIGVFHLVSWRVMHVNCVCLKNESGCNTGMLCNYMYEYVFWNAVQISNTCRSDSLIGHNNSCFNYLILPYIKMSLP